jgi:ABC-type ATPase involved in cell division
LVKDLLPKINLNLLSQHKRKEIKKKNQRTLLGNVSLQDKQHQLPSQFMTRKKLIRLSLALVHQATLALDQST